MKSKFVIQVLHKMFGWITCWGTDTNCISSATVSKNKIDLLYKNDDKVCKSRIKMFTS